MANVAVAVLRFGEHRDFIFERSGNCVLGAQVHNALFTIHKNLITVERLCRDALGLYHQWDCQRARNYPCMAADAAFFKDNRTQLAPVFK